MQFIKMKHDLSSWLGLRKNQTYRRVENLGVRHATNGSFEEYYRVINDHGKEVDVSGRYAIPFINSKGA